MGIHDKDTGEVIGDYNPKDKTRKKPHTYFIEFYKNIIDAHIDITNVMRAIIGEMDGKNIVILDGHLKETLCNYYQMSGGSIKTNLSRMINKNIAIRRAPCVYFINPFFFTKTNLYNIIELRGNYIALSATKEIKEHE